MNEQQLKALLDKYGKLNFVQRMKDKKAPTIANPDGSSSTHRMEWGEADGKYYVYPTIIQDPKTGKLKELSSDEAWNYAVKNNELIPFDDPKQAEEFSKHEGAAYQQYFGGKNQGNMEYTREQLKQDYAAAQSLKGDATAYAGALKAIFDKMGSADKATFDANDSANILREWNQYDPAAVAATTQALNQQKAATKAGQLNQGLDILFQGIQMGIGGSQVARAKNAAAQLQRPGLPGVPSSSPQLAQALNNTQLGTINANDVLRPAQAGIQDAYNAALNQAQVASGGQAGAYQGMANLANLQRMRANLGLAPVAQSAKVQNQELYNQLLAQKQAETQNQFANRFGNAQVAFDQYDKDAQAVGGLGSVGRTNMLNAGRQLTQSLQGLSPYLTQSIAQPYVQPQAPNVGAMAIQTRPMLKSTMPNSPFTDQASNDFYNNARKENYFRNRGYGTDYIEAMSPLNNPTVNPQLVRPDPNYPYGY